MYNGEAIWEEMSPRQVLAICNFSHSRKRWQHPQISNIFERNWGVCVARQVSTSEKEKIK